MGTGGEEPNTSTNDVEVEDGVRWLTSKDEDAVEGNDDKEDEKYRKQMSASFFWRSWLLIILCFLGFLPAILVFISEKAWYLITWYSFPPGGALTEDIPKKNTLSAHATFGVLWVGVVLFQTWAGATHGVNRRKMHRIIGSVSPIIFVPFAGTAAYTQVVTLSPPGSSVSRNSIPASITPFYILFFMVIGVGLAYYAAKFKRNYALHKDCILFTIAYSSIPGISRVLLYLAQSFFRVDCSIVTTGYGPELSLQAVTAISTVMCMALLGQAWYSLGRLGPNNKLNRIGMGSLLFLAFFSAFDSLRLGLQFGSSCPSNE